MLYGQLARWYLEVMNYQKSKNVSFDITSFNHKIYVMMLLRHVNYIPNLQQNLAL